MNVVDSSAWLSFFSGDQNSSIFEKPILDINHLLVPSITITEVFKSVFRQCGEESALSVIAHMEQGKVISLSSELAVNAASFGILYKLPLADSIIFATAKKYDATIWTQDADFEGLPNVRFYKKVGAK